MKRGASIKDGKKYSDQAVRISQAFPYSLDEAEEIVERYKGISCVYDIVNVGLQTGFWPDPSDLAAVALK